MAWFVAGAFLVWLRRGIAFSNDEFDWISHAGIDSLEGLLRPNNGHLTFVPLLIFRASLNVFGTTAVPFTYVEILLLTIISAGIYVFSKERVGSSLALAPAIMPLFLGAAWPMLMPSMIAIFWCCPIAFGLWAFIAESRGGRIYDALACALLLLAVASFSVGLSFIAACGVSILLKPDRWRRIWIAAVPTVAYAVWYIWARQFGSNGIELSNLLFLPFYIVDAIAGAVAAVFGRNLPFGPGTSLHLNGFDFDRLTLVVLIALIEAVAIGWAVRWRLKHGPRLTSLWPVLAMAAVWWISQDLVLGLYRSPVEYRYLFWGAIVVFMLAVEILRGIELPRRTIAAVLALCVFAIVSNGPRFRDGRGLVNLTEESKADLASLELAGKRADPTYVLNGTLTPQAPYIFLVTGPYLETVERFGSPAFSLDELAEQPEITREAADATLARALLLGLTPTHGRQGVRCRRVGPATGGSVVATLPLGGAILESPERRQLRLGRFGGVPTAVLGGIPPGRRMLLRIHPDASNVRWRIGAAGTAPLTICALSKATI